MTDPLSTLTVQVWGRPPVSRWSLDILDRTNWRPNPEGCQRVAGGRLGEWGTTTGRPRPRSPHPGGVLELPFPDRCNPRVESISRGGRSGTPPGCGVYSAERVRWSPPQPPSATTGYLLPTLWVDQSRMSKRQGQTGGPMSLPPDSPHPRGVNAKGLTLKRRIPVNNHGL
jgi:hypothetical protein